MAKKRLRNIVYKIKLSKLKDSVNEDDYKQYKFKELGYLVLTWGFESDDMTNWHGFIKPEDLKELIGEKQWSKFCQGKREFIIERKKKK